LRKKIPKKDLNPNMHPLTFTQVVGKVHEKAGARSATKGTGKVTKVTKKKEARVALFE
jgi:hypothetical protein